MRNFLHPLYALALCVSLHLSATEPSKEAAPLNIQISSSILNEYQQILEIFSSKKKQWSDLTFKLETIEKKLNQLDLKPTISSYTAVSAIWRELYDLNDNLENIHSIPHTLVKRFVENEKQIQEYENDSQLKEWQQLQKKIIKEHLHAINESEKSFTNTRSQIHRLFLRSSKKRARIISYLVIDKKGQLFTWTDQYFKDIAIEILAIPQRWLGIFELSLQKVLNDFRSGLAGWIQLIKEVLSLLVFIAIGFLSYRFSSKFAVFLDKKRDEHLRLSLKNKLSQLKALWLQRILPYIPWLGFLLFIDTSENLFQQSYFSEFSIVFPYLRYYVFYRFFRIFVNQTLSSHALLGSYLFVFKNKTKILKTSRNLGIYLLLVLFTLHTVRSSTGEGFVFLWAKSAFRHLTFFTMMLTAFIWRSEFLTITKKLFNGKVQGILAFTFSNRLSVFTSLPGALFVVITIFLQRVYLWGEQFEWVRSVSAEIFRKKVEGLSKKEPQTKKPLPTEYTSYFEKTHYDTSSNLKSSQLEVFNKLCTHIDDWHLNKSEANIFGVVGEKGIGKTTLLHHLENYSQSKKLKTIRITIDQKSIATDIFENLLNSNNSDPVVVLVDQAQNLFLSQVGGFENFKSFLRHTQKDEKEVFWCVSFNQHSWQYLQAVMNKSRYFNDVLRIKKWSEEDIKDLILTHHKNTGFEKIYDKVLMASSNNADFESIGYIETKYFRLLWEESLGNPEVAKKVWLDSLSYYYGHRVKIGIPRDRTDSISGLPDDFYFVLAAIVRHENLSISEIIKVSNLSEDLVVNAIKNCINNGFIINKDGQLELTPLWQHSVYSTLKQKNFIYG